MRDAAWKDWYYFQHKDKFYNSSGNLFEKYVSDVLKQVYPGFMNPNPAGSSGDRGCDGISGDGKTVYACYGKTNTAQSSRDSHVAEKIGDDLEKAVNNWSRMKTWRFVTNAGLGPSTVSKIIDLTEQYSEPKTTRPVKIEIWECEELWNRLNRLDEKQISLILPPAPHAQDARFVDIVEAIERIGGDVTGTLPKPRIGKVSIQKMDYNKISELNRIAFNEGRQRAKEIERWFERQTDTQLYDTKAELLKEHYREVCKSCSNSNEILERLYVYVGGPDFRYDESRKMAVYTVISYFFDRCDIFKDPNEDSSHLETKESNAVTD